jgi:hypothetical protein
MKSAGGLGDRWRDVCGILTNADDKAREESPDTQWKAARPGS